MSRRVRGRLTLLLGASLVAVVALVSSGSALGGASQSCGTVTLNEYGWAGSTANTHVAKYVLEKRLGCTVEIEKIAEVPSYQAMADGEVDAVLEDWGYPDQYRQYVTRQKTVVHNGSNGLTGHIGWFIPAICSRSTRRSRPGAASRAGRRSSGAPSPARRGCSSAATPRSSRRTRS